MSRNLQPIDCAKHVHVIDRRTNPNNWACECKAMAADNERWRGQPFQFIYSDQEYADFEQKQQQQK
jgi:hypothetical protein